MSASHISDKRQRRSKQYIALHQQLKREISAPEAVESSKRDRKMAAHLLFRNQAES